MRKMFAFLGLTTALFVSAAHAATTVFSTDFWHRLYQREFGGAERLEPDRHHRSNRLADSR